MIYTNKKGSLLIMVILILFVTLTFITAAVWSVTCLNNLQKNENIIIKENMAMSSLNNTFDNISMYGDKKANLRGPLNIIMNGETAYGDITFDYLNSEAKDKKYLILDAKITDTKGKATIRKKVFKPVPLFNYSHFVINPDESLGDNNVREECTGIIRANKVDNTFTNISGSAIKDKGKPFIYMQDINIDRYKDIADIKIDKSQDIALLFDYNDNIIVYPFMETYKIHDNSLIVVNNSKYKVRIIGVNNDLYTDININYNITFITDSPIYIESNINSDNYDFIFVSTFKDTDIETAFNMDINKYIEHKFIPDGNNIDINSLYYGIGTGYNEIKLKSIFFAPNGSFGFLENTYDGGVYYNPDIYHMYRIIGGIIEYNSNYKMKKFETLPLPYIHLTCERNEKLLNIKSDKEFGFIAPPLAKNIFAFNFKYF